MIIYELVWKTLWRAWLDLNSTGKGIILIPFFVLGLMASVTFIIGLLVLLIHKQFLNKEAKNYFNNYKK